MDDAQPPGPTAAGQQDAAPAPPERTRQGVAPGDGAPASAGPGHLQSSGVLGGLDELLMLPAQPRQVKFAPFAGGRRGPRPATTAPAPAAPPAPAGHAPAPRNPPTLAAAAAPLAATHDLGHSASARGEAPLASQSATAGAAAVRGTPQTEPESSQVPPRDAAAHGTQPAHAATQGTQPLDTAAAGDLRLRGAASAPTVHPAPAAARDAEPPEPELACPHAGQSWAGGVHVNAPCYAGVASTSAGLPERSSDGPAPPLLSAVATVAPKGAAAQSNVQSSGATAHSAEHAEALGFLMGASAADQLLQGTRVRRAVPVKPARRPGMGAQERAVLAAAGTAAASDAPARPAAAPVCDGTQPASDTHSPSPPLDAPDGDPRGADMATPLCVVDAPRPDAAHPLGSGAGGQASGQEASGAVVPAPDAAQAAVAAAAAPVDPPPEQPDAPHTTRALPGGLDVDCDALPKKQRRAAPTLVARRRVPVAAAGGEAGAQPEAADVASTSAVAAVVTRPTLPVPTSGRVEASPPAQAQQPVPHAPAPEAAAHVAAADLPTSAPAPASAPTGPLGAGLRLGRAPRDPRPLAARGRSPSAPDDARSLPAAAEPAGSRGRAQRTGPTLAGAASGVSTASDASTAPALSLLADAAVAEQGRDIERTAKRRRTSKAAAERAAVAPAPPDVGLSASPRPAPLQAKGRRTRASGATRAEHAPTMELSGQEGAAGALASGGGGAEPSLAAAQAVGRNDGPAKLARQPKRSAGAAEDEAAKQLRRRQEQRSRARERAVAVAEEDARRKEEAAVAAAVVCRLVRSAGTASSKKGAMGWLRLVSMLRGRASGAQDEDAVEHGGAADTGMALVLHPDHALVPTGRRRRRRGHSSASGADSDTDTGTETDGGRAHGRRASRKWNSRAAAAARGTRYVREAEMRALQAAGLGIVELEAVDPNEAIDPDTWSLKRIIARTQAWEKAKIAAEKAAQKLAAAAARSDGNAALGPAEGGARALPAAGGAGQPGGASGGGAAAAPAPAAPQLRVVDGRLVVDTASLTVTAQQRDDLGQYARVEEDTRFVTSITYMKRLAPARWAPADTALFYRALAAFGTDFSLICMLFPAMQRQHVKRKYTKELKENPAKVNAALAAQAGQGSAERAQLLDTVRARIAEVSAAAAQAEAGMPHPAAPAVQDAGQAAPAAEGGSAASPTGARAGAQPGGPAADAADAEAGGVAQAMDAEHAAGMPVYGTGAYGHANDYDDDDGYYY